MLEPDKQKRNEIKAAINAESFKGTINGDATSTAIKSIVVKVCRYQRYY